MVVAGARVLELVAGIGFGFVVGTGAALCWLIRSQSRTRLSSAPDASTPRRFGDHSTQLRGDE